MTPRFGQRADRIGRLLDAAALVLTLWIFAWTLAKISLPLSPPPLPGERWGNTSFSDFLTLMAGDRFHKDGYLNNYLLDNMTVGFKEFSRGWYAYQVPLSVPNSAIYYTHYGSIDGILNGLLRDLGVNDLLTFYKIAAIVSCSGLVFWYVTASMLFGRVVGLISLFFLGTSLVFLRLTETIAAYSYDFLFAFGAAMLFVIANRPALPAWSKRLALIGSWGLTFVQASNTPEFILWLQIFFIGYLWIDHRRARTAWQPGAFGPIPATRFSRPRNDAVWIGIIMMLAPVAAWAAHFFQLTWVLGSSANALRDLGDALHRRTTGFALASETPFQHFSLVQALPFINHQMMSMLHVSLVSAAVLVAVARWGTSQALVTGADDARSLSAQWNLICVLFLAGLAFWVVFPQATVTATEITLRLFLPFAGALIGFCTVLLWRVLPRHDVAIGTKLVAVGAVVVVLAPVLQERLSGKITDINLHIAAPAYTGRTTNEIRILTDFVRASTRYGDIVLTPIDVGETGHPNYPHPAYEYLSQRRFEMVRTVVDVSRAVANFEKTRQSLPMGNPAHHVSYYLLLDDTRDLFEFRSITTCLGEPTAIASTRSWWVDHRGGVPMFPGGPKERDVVFSLSLLDPKKIATCTFDAMGRAARELNVPVIGPDRPAGALAAPNALRR